MLKTFLVMHNSKLVSSKRTSRSSTLREQLKMLFLFRDIKLSQRTLRWKLTSLVSHQNLAMLVSLRTIRKIFQWMLKISPLNQMKKELNKCLLTCSLMLWSLQEKAESLKSNVNWSRVFMKKMIKRCKRHTSQNCWRSSRKAIHH